MDLLSQTLVRLNISVIHYASRWIQPLGAWLHGKSQIYVARALEAYRGNALNLAETYYQKAILWKPKDAELHSALGQVYYEDARPTDAEAEFHKALNYDYGSLRALKGLGVLSQEQGNLSIAMYLYLRYLELKPDDASVCYNLGAVFHNLGKYQEADEYYERAEREDPNDLLIRKSRAQLLLTLGRSKEAGATLTRAREIAPQDAEVDRLMGIALEVHGEKAEALACYKSAIDKDANDADAHSLYSSLASAEGRQQEAVEHAQMALDLYRQIGNNQRAAEASANLGWIYYDLGDWAGCVQASTEALRLNPDLPAHHNLGLALLQLGRAAEARKEYEAGCAHSDQIARFGNLAINDLREALKKNPNLAGAREILEMVEAKYQSVSNTLTNPARQAAECSTNEA